MTTDILKERLKQAEDTRDKHLSELNSSLGRCAELRELIAMMEAAKQGEDPEQL